MQHTKKPRQQVAFVILVSKLETHRKLGQQILVLKASQRKKTMSMNVAFVVVVLERAILIKD
jgi:hypothetical protein